MNAHHWRPSSFRRLMLNPGSQTGKTSRSSCSRCSALTARTVLTVRHQPLLPDHQPAGQEDLRRARPGPDNRRGVPALAWPGASRV